MQRLLACCLLATTLSRIDVLAQTLNLSQAIDVKESLSPS